MAKIIVPPSGRTPELVPENSRYRLPSVETTMAITQEMASDWLSYRSHYDLRPISRRIANNYRFLMETGRWHEGTPEGLIFDTEGWIISARHRLRALANADPNKLIQYYGAPELRFRIFPNEPRDLRMILDGGYKRTAAHMLRVPYATTVSAGARILAALADGDRYGMPRYNNVSTVEVVETARLWPELGWYAKQMHAGQLDSGIVAGTHAAVLAQAARTEHIGKISDWVETTTTGVRLERNDPRFNLRRRFKQGLPSGKDAPNRRDHAYALIVKAWNFYAADERVATLRWSTSEGLPVVTGFTYPNPNLETE